MRLHSDFHPEKGYLCALALLFSKQPPQLNYPPDSVPSKVCIWIRLETYAIKRGISYFAPKINFRRSLLY